MIRVLIAEDYLVVRAGIRALLEQLLFISEKAVEKRRARLMES